MLLGYKYDFNAFNVDIISIKNYFFDTDIVMTLQVPTKIVM